MQPVRHHQLHASPTTGRNHLAALPRGYGHRFFTEYVYARFGGSNGVFGVHRVWERDIHRINLRQAFIELVVRESMMQAIPLGEFMPLGSVAADDGDQLRVAPCIRESWQYGDLCDVAKAHDRVTNAFSRHLNTSLAATVTGDGIVIVFSHVVWQMLADCASCDEL
jgi:hypothetical protein